jgi:hypothetical protein
MRTWRFNDGMEGEKLSYEERKKRKFMDKETKALLGDREYIKKEVEKFLKDGGLIEMIETNEDINNDPVGLMPQKRGINISDLY